MIYLCLIIIFTVKNIDFHVCLREKITFSLTLYQGAFSLTLYQGVTIGHNVKKSETLFIISYNFIFILLFH